MGFLEALEAERQRLQKRVGELHKERDSIDDELSKISAKDARALADDMGVRPESLMAVRKPTWLAHIKGVAAFEHQVPPDTLSHLPQRKDLRELIKENREKYCEPIAKTRTVPPDDVEGFNRA